MTPADADVVLAYNKAFELAKVREKELRNVADSSRLWCCACAVLSDGFVTSATEKRFLEYGNSLDSVSQLAETIESHLRRARSSEQNEKVTVKAVCQVDSHGFAHAPFAPGRAYLYEYGHFETKVFCHTKGSKETDETVIISNPVQVKDLMPFSPDLQAVQ